MKKIRSKRPLLIVLSILFAITITASIVFASVSSSTGLSISDSIPSDDEETTTNNELGTEDVQSILEELQESKLDTSAALSLLDRIIEKALLTNNTALKEYAEYAQQAIQLKEQLGSVQAKIDALKATNTNLAEIDSQLQDSLENALSLSDLEGSISSNASSILEKVDTTSAAMQNAMAKVTALKNSTSNGNSTEVNALTELILLNAAIEEGSLDSSMQKTAQNTLSALINSFKAAEKSKYNSKTYASLVSASSEYSAMGNKCEAINPNQIVMLNEKNTLKHAAIVYDNEVMISLDDALQYIDATVQHGTNNSTISIQSPNKLVEIAAGKNIAYVNDKSMNMAVPVLNIKGTVYISAEFFARAYNISYEYVRDSNFIIFYDNLNQLSASGNSNGASNNSSSSSTPTDK